MGTMLHNIGLHIFFHMTFDKLPSTVAATGVENRRSTAELENPGQVFDSFFNWLLLLERKSYSTIIIILDLIYPHRYIIKSSQGLWSVLCISGYN